MLQTLLKDEQKKRSWSSRDLAEAVGTSHTTILRALRGELVDLDTIVKIANWLNVRPSTLLDGFGKKDQVAVRVAVLVERVPGLAKPLEAAAEAIDEGRAEPELIEDIVAYATYKLNMAGGSGAKSKRGRST